MSVITNDTIKSAMALTALEQVNDPEVELNIVDLGLIRQLDFDDMSKRIFIQMTLTTQFCPMGESIVTGVRNVLMHTFPGNEIVVQLDFSRKWNTDMISEKGKLFLNRK